MKIIHTADIHLDSPLSKIHDSAARRFELLRAVSDMSQYADNNGVSAIIVAGDLFDGETASEQTIESVAEIIRNGKADWFVLRGNHGDVSPYRKLEQRCNVKMFGSEWTYYNLGNVTICGRELGNNDEEHYRELRLDAQRYNIVVLHGDVDNDGYGLIDGKALAKSNARYVALGHRHSFAELKFGRVKACYSGTLESRGFDEQSPTGFVVIDTDSDSFSFVEQAIRSVSTATVCVDNVTSDIALRNKISDCTAQISKRNYLNVVFTGALKTGVHLELVAKEFLRDKFFALRIEDRTTSDYDLDALSCEVSLRGEFVKLAMQISDERTRDEILKFGLSALDGEV
ncbi:MAG: metallophosphoesterase [Corallococcus sp.]|nr:metallophosphoesterase [Corallococcus sp.]